MSYASSRFLCAGVIASAAFFAMASAHATTLTTGDISVTLGNPQPAETAVNLTNATGVTSGTGLVGTTTINFTNFNVNVDLANGNATIKPSTNSDIITTFNVSVPGGNFFQDLEFTIDLGNISTTDISIVAKNGNTQVGTYSNSAITGQNDNAFLVLAVSGLFTELDISSVTGFNQAKNFAISGLCSTDCQTIGGGGAGQTPIPAALPLFGSVLGGGFVFSRLRRKRRTA